MHEWAYFDANGDRTTESVAAFKGRIVRVESGVPAPPNHASLGLYEYHDVHAVNSPEHKQTFGSLRKMKAWIADQRK